MSTRKQRMLFRYLSSLMLTVCFVSMLSAACSRSSTGGQVKDDSPYDRSEGYNYAAKKSRTPAAPSAIREEYDRMSNSKEAPASEPGSPESADSPIGDESVVIYESDCSVSVRSVSDSIRAIESFVKKFDAYVESVSSVSGYSAADVTVRVPAAKFDLFLSSVPQLGTVTAKTVSASNVSDEYRDLSSRLESAEKVKDRLNALLKKEIRVSGRISILREIDRINSTIASVKARMEYLKGKADLSTVRIHLAAERGDTVSRYLPSPFQWIAALSPSVRSISKAASFEADPPGGYFILEKEFSDGGSFLYAAPGDAAALRLGIAENYPRADQQFWIKAFDDDAVNRRYTQLTALTVEGKGVRFAVRSFRTTGETFYAVAFAVRDDELFVAEAVFTGEENYKTNYPQFEQFMKSVRWK